MKLIKHAQTKKGEQFDRGRKKKVESNLEAGGTLCDLEASPQTPVSRPDRTSLTSSLTVESFRLVSWY